MIIVCSFMDAYREIPPTWRPELRFRNSSHEAGGDSAS